MKSKYGKELDVERKADELLAALGRELGESRALYMEKLIQEIEAETEAEETPVLLPAKPKGKGKGRIRRVTVLAAVLIIVMGAMAVSSEAVRLKLSSLFFRQDSRSVEVVDDRTVVDVSEVQVNYVPEGFEVVSDDIYGDFNRVIYYGNGMNEIIISVTKTEMYAFNVDDDRMEGKSVKINDKEGQIFTTDVNRFVVWQIGDCTFDITTTINEEEVIDIARQIYIR